MMKTLPREMTSISVEALFLGHGKRSPLREELASADPLRSPR